MSVGSGVAVAVGVAVGVAVVVGVAVGEAVAVGDGCVRSEVATLHPAEGTESRTSASTTTGAKAVRTLAKM